VPVAPVTNLLIDWRAARIPALSEKIHLIGDRLPVEVPRLSSTRKTDLVREWLQAVKSEPPHLLSARLRQLDQLGRTLSSPLFWPLIEALSKLPPDPRIATFATRVLVRDLRIPLTMKLLRRLLDCVETHGDDTHYRSLELGLSLNLLGDQLAGRAVRLMQSGLQRSPKGPSLTAEERRIIAAKTWEIPASAPSTESLFDAIFEDPRDLTRRNVLADQLLEQGHPRGEFISLQLANASPKRQKQLLKAHGAEWLGGLKDVIDLKDFRPIFRNGFVADVTVRAVKQAQFLLAADAKEWATVTRVRGGLQRFSPSMRGLDDAGAVKLEAVKQLTREKWPLTLRSLELRGVTPGHAVDALTELPHPISWLSLFFDVWEPTRWMRDELPRIRELTGLERLRITAQDNEVIPRLLGVMGLDWVPAHVGVLEVRDDERLVVLRRDGASWAAEFVDLEQPWPRMSQWKTIVAGFTWLEPSRVKVRVSCNVESKDSLELVERVRRFKHPVEVEELEDLPPELGW
jgi:uncharacterized protein (TIGR02996 family)